MDTQVFNPETATMEEVVTRLLNLEDEEQGYEEDLREADGFTDAVRAGELWAKGLASVRQLRRIEKYDGIPLYDCHEKLYAVMCPDGDIPPGRLAVHLRDFWTRAIGDDWERIKCPTFAFGFLSGARHAWKQIQAEAELSGHNL